MKLRKANMAEVELLHFLKDCKRLPIRALGTNAGKPAEGGHDGWARHMTAEADHEAAEDEAESER